MHQITYMYKIPHIMEARFIDSYGPIDAASSHLSSTLEFKHISVNEVPVALGDSVLKWNCWLVLDGTDYKVSISTYKDAHGLMIGDCDKILSRVFSDELVRLSSAPIRPESIQGAICGHIKKAVNAIKEKDKVAHVKAKAEPDLFTIADSLPSAHIDVLCPLCSAGKPPPVRTRRTAAYPLADTVMHLNDQHKADRDYIANWIDELHDKGIINAEFESWNEESKALPERATSAMLPQWKGIELPDINSLTGEDAPETVPTTSMKYCVDGAQSKIQWKDEVGEWKNADFISTGPFSVEQEHEDFDILKAKYMATLNIKGSEAFKIIKGDSNE